MGFTGIIFFEVGRNTWTIIVDDESTSNELEVIDMDERMKSLKECIEEMNTMISQIDAQLLELAVHEAALRKSRAELDNKGIDVSEGADAMENAMYALCAASRKELVGAREGIIKRLDQAEQLLAILKDLD